MPRVTLSGENRFLLQTELENSINDFVSKHGQMGVESIDAEEASFERIKESLLASSLFAEAKLVIIKQPEANKQLVEELEHIIGAVDDSTDVIFVVPKPDKRAKYYKTLQKMTELKTLDALDARALASWLVNEAKSQNASLNLRDAQFLVERVGTSQAILKQELDKLVLHNPQIDQKAITELTEPQPQSTVFELLDAAFGGNRQKTLKLYEEQRQLKTEPLAILGMIAWQLHILAIVVTAKDKTPGDIAKDAKVHPFVVTKTSKIAKNLGYTRLKELIDQALNLDIRLKSQSINADDALKHYLLSLAIS